LIAAGFDSALGDPKGGLNVTPSGFAHMTALLKLACNGRVVMSLEGGYDVGITAACFEACLRVLLGDDAPPLSGMARGPSPAARQLMRELRRAHAPHWPCLDDA
jgi:histone deacetylase 6